MRSRDDRDRLLGRVDAGENTRIFDDAGKAFANDLRIEMGQVEIHVVALGTDPTAFANFNRDRTAHHVAGGQILGVGRVALHEFLALGIGEVSAFAPSALGEQHANAVDAGRMELDEFHVLKRQPGAQHHAIAVAGAGMGRGAGEISASVSAGRQNRHMGVEAVDRAVFEIPGDNAAAGAVFHHQIDGEIFDEERDIMFERLLIQRVQDRVAGAVGGGAGALRRAFAETRRHAAEGSLINLPIRCPRKRHAVMFELDDRRDRLAAHIFDGVLIAQPVRTLDGVVHMPAPIVFAHIPKRGGYAALSGNRVAARREDFGNAAGGKPGGGHAEGGAQAGAAGADHHDIAFMIDDFVSRGHGSGA